VESTGIWNEGGGAVTSYSCRTVTLVCHEVREKIDTQRRREKIIMKNRFGARSSTGITESIFLRSRKTAGLVKKFNNRLHQKWGKGGASNGQNVADKREAACEIL